MNKLREKFQQLREENKKALICFITAGFPNLKTTEKLIKILTSSGVDIIELGVPFSDPIADGPIIQYTSFEALKNKISLEKVLKFVKKNRCKTSSAIVIMSYLNPIYKYGFERFFLDAKCSGIDGVIIPDLIPEENEFIEEFSNKYNLPIVYFLSTTSSELRQKVIFEKSQEFIYVISVTGVTGPREKFPKSILKFLKNLREKTSLPLILGFGVSSPEQIKPLLSYIDGVVIGSALLKIIDDSSPYELSEKIKKFLYPFRKVLEDSFTKGKK